MVAGNGRVKIAHISFEPPEHDARVQRAIDAGKTEGLITGLIAPGHGVDIPPMTLRRKSWLAARFFVGGLTGGWNAIRAWKSTHPWKVAVDGLVRHQPQIVHAHNWDTLPAAIIASKVCNAKVVYDAHELSAALHSDRLLWRLTMIPAITSLERHYITQTDAVITVSEGYARALQNHYGLARTPSVVRNIPDIPALERLPDPGDHVILHYHGVVAPGRGLETMMKCLRRLPSKYRARIIGPERRAGYRAHLRQLAGRLGVLDRIELRQEVPFAQLVAEAADAAFGFCMFTSQDAHVRYALPNKIFEYMKAGLIPVVSGSRELDTLITEMSCGIAAEGLNSSSLAQEISSLNQFEISALRGQILKFSNAHDWEIEKKKIIEIYQSLGCC